MKLLSLKSINNALAVLRKLFALAQEQGVIAHVPSVKLFKTEKPPLSSSPSRRPSACRRTASRSPLA